MHLSRLSLLLAIAVLLTAALGACRQPSTTDVDQTEEGVLRLGSVEAVDTVARAVAPSGRPLVIEGFRGPVALEGGPGSTADLQFVRRGRGADAETARGVLEDITITESGSDESYTYTLETDGGAYAAVDVRGTVPRDADLTVDRSTGPVTLDGIAGPLTVTHEHGPVTIRGAAASVEVEIKNGDVAVQMAALPADATVALRTVNGDVTVRLPPDASAQLSAETSAGLIRTQGLALAEQNFTPRDAGGEYTAQLGPGEAPVELQTKNGSIRIAALADSDTTQAAPIDTVGTPTAAPDTAPAPAPDRAVPPADTTVAAPAAPDTAAPGGARPDPAAADTVQD
jgi:FlaG/FlaF family flagellin (archaellin)